MKLSDQTKINNEWKRGNFPTSIRLYPFDFSPPLNSLSSFSSFLSHSASLYPLTASPPFHPLWCCRTPLSIRILNQIKIGSVAAAAGPCHAGLLVVINEQWLIAPSFGGNTVNLCGTFSLLTVSPFKQPSRLSLSAFLSLSIIRV